MDVNIIVVGIISGAALLLGIKNWSRNKQIDGHLNRLELDINALKEDVDKLKPPKEIENTDDNNGKDPKGKGKGEVLEPITDPLSYFQIAENWYGQGKIIRVKFKEGIHTEETYVYDHDYVYNQVIHIYREKQSWIDYRRYSSSTNIPRDIIQLFKNQNNIPRNALHFVAFPINN